MQQLDFMGHQLTLQGFKPNPSKVEAILKLETPKTKEDIERLNGTVNYLAKFLPKHSQVMQPPRRLTQKGTEWCWGKAEDKAHTEVKQLVTKAPVLACYSPHKELVIQGDASNWKLGAALTKEEQPLVYASQALTDPETSYATKEKEMMNVDWRNGISSFLVVVLLSEQNTSHLRRSQRNLLTGHQGACKGYCLEVWPMTLRCTTFPAI